MTANPLADAVAKVLDIGPPPCFRVIASPYFVQDKMLIMDPAGLGIVDPATHAEHPGLKILVTPDEESRERVLGWARELGLDLLED